MLLFDSFISPKHWVTFRHRRQCSTATNQISGHIKKHLKHSKNNSRKKRKGLGLGREEANPFTFCAEFTLALPRLLRSLLRMLHLPYQGKIRVIRLHLLLPPPLPHYSVLLITSPAYTPTRIAKPLCGPSRLENP